MAQKHFSRQNCVSSSTTLNKNYVSMFCGLGEEPTRFRKKEKEKEEIKKKKLIAAKNGLVEMKGYLKTYEYNHVKYFCRT